ncbi:MAG: tetratricopeptide repeat protein [bacterium]
MKQTPMYGLIAILLGIFLCPVTVYGADTPKKLYNQADDYFSSGQYEKAEKAYRRFMSNFPTHSRYWDATYGLARTYQRLGNLMEANEQFRAVFKNHPDERIQGDALFHQIEIAIMKDNRSRAKRLLETFISTYPDHPLRSTAEKQLKLISKIMKRSPLSESARNESDQKDTTPSIDVDTTPKSVGKVMPNMRFTGDTGNTKSISDPVANVGKKVDTVPAARFRSVRKKLKKNKRMYKKAKKKLENTRELYKSAQDRAREFERRLQDATSTVKKLRGTIKKLRKALNQKIKNLATDTELHQAARVTNLSDTIQQILNEKISSLRSRAQERLQSGDDSGAMKILKKIVNRNPRAEDYHKLAQLKLQYGRDTGQIESLLDDAIRSSDTNPIPYVLTKFEYLVQTGQTNKFDKLLGEWENVITSRGTSPQKSRFYLLKGQRLLKDQREDEAFFVLMKSIREAPKSSWGSQARRIVRQEL